MVDELLAEKKFKGRVVSETLYGLDADYGEVENVMRLYQTGKCLTIEWIIGDEKNPTDTAEIGIWTAGKKVVDYDGVFELPSEAVELLKEYGLETSEVV